MRCQSSEDSRIVLRCKDTKSESNRLKLPQEKRTGPHLEKERSSAAPTCDLKATFEVYARQLRTFQALGCRLCEIDRHAGRAGVSKREIRMELDFPGNFCKFCEHSRKFAQDSERRNFFKKAHWAATWGKTFLAARTWIFVHL